ncbi:hypothetical protein ABG067_000797 [Albugo candida]
MESTKTCKGTILGEDQEVETPPGDLDSEEKLVWEDILSNSDVPVTCDLNETLESETHEFAREFTRSRNWDAESAGHVTYLATVKGILDSSQDDEQKHNFEPEKERELETYHITKQQLAIRYNQSIGHRRPRGVQIRRMRERKRTKINLKNAKLLKAARLKHSLLSKNGAENGLVGLEL